MYNTPARRHPKPPRWHLDFVNFSGNRTGDDSRDNDHIVTRLALNSPNSPTNQIKPSSAAHHLPHRLNHDRQLARLVREAASFSSCTCNVQPKDSGKQVVLNFSPPGYFLAVAVPTLQAFSVGNQVTTCSRVIKCVSVTPFFAGHDIERIKYVFSITDWGPVTATLFLSTRNIMVQAGNFNSNAAPVAPSSSHPSSTPG